MSYEAELLGAYMHLSAASRSDIVTDIGRKADAEIAKLKKELEEANEAVIAAQMLAFEKGKDAAKAELAEARKVIEELVADYNGLMLVVEYEGVSPTEIEDTYKHLEAARAFLAARETQG